MSLAKALKNTAGKLVAKFGGEVTIRYVTPAAYNTTTGALAESTSDIEVKGQVKDVKQSEVNDLIQADDRLLTVAAKDVTTTPGTKDRVVIGSVVYQIIRVRTTEQDNTPLTYELTLRS